MEDADLNETIGGEDVSVREDSILQVTPTNWEALTDLTVWKCAAMCVTTEK